ncbi:MAG: hypothetical protein ACOYLH_09395 [Flavobacteriales bacterium]
MKLFAKFYALGALALLFSISSSAQKVGDRYVNSSEAIFEGVKAHDEENYRDAIKYYERIGAGDTLYALAQYELALSAQADKQYDRAIQACEELLRLETPYRLETILLCASSYEKKEDHVKAQELYATAISEYGHSHRGYFERAANFRAQKMWDKAINDYEASAQLNIFHPGTHANFGIMAAQADQPALAIMALYTALIANNSDPNYVLSILSIIENIGNGTFKKDDEVTSPVFSSLEDLASLNELVMSKVAISAKYKSKVKGNYVYMKQLQLICEQMPASVETSSPLIKFYTDFYRKAWAGQQFVGMAIYPLVNVNSTITNPMVKKNKKKIEAFAKFAGPLFEEEGKGTKFTRKGEELTGDFYFSNSVLQGIGKLDPKIGKEGEWYFYHENGEVANIYSYFANKPDGLCKSYFSNGVLRKEEDYDNGLYNGKVREYNVTGFIVSESTYENGKESGAGKAFHDNGAPQYEYSVNANGEVPVTYFSENGIKSSTMTMKGSDPIGKATYYLANGNEDYSLDFVNGKTNGSFVTHFSDGTKSVEGEFKDGEREGLWKYYYHEGGVKEEGTYKNGELNGEWKNYYPNGQLETTSFYKSDKLDGVRKEYGRTGAVISEIEYKQGKAVAYKYLDKNGNVIKEAKSSGGKVFIESYNEIGIKFAEGMIEKENRVGEWKFYYPNGVLKEINNYKDGELDGKATSYHENGKVSSEMYYEKGLAQGYYREYNQIGTITEEGYYEDSQLHGPITAYYNNGQLRSKDFYWKGSKNGEQVDYRLDGSRDISFFYHHGILLNAICYDRDSKEVGKSDLNTGTGEYTLYNNWGVPVLKGNLKYGGFDGNIQEFYTDGKPFNSHSHFDGMREGEYKEYALNGNLIEEGQYFNDEMTGTWKYYAAIDGKLMRTVEMKNDSRNGKYTIYYKSGAVCEERNYLNDQRDGDIKMYAPDGSLMIEMHYIDGVLLSYTYLGSNGKLVADKIVENDNGTITAYYQNGKKSIEFGLKNGDFEGDYTVYLPSGKILKQFSYVDGWSVNKAVDYYPNGQLYMEGNYLNGNENGTFKWYHENGKLAIEETYQEGFLNGPIKFYDAKGKLILEGEYYYGEFKEKK